MDEIISWLGSIAIIAVFFWFQVQIDQLSKGWFNTTLLLLSVLGEAYLIWAWSSRDL